MSEFKIVKCQKCDAALVELLGETVDRCEQCGYSFGTPKNSKNHNDISSSLNKSSQSTSVIKEIISQVPSTFGDIIKSVQKKVAEQNAKKPTSKTKAPVKQKSWIFTMIKWYFLLALFSGILNGILSN